MTTNQPAEVFDFVIIGSGFGGSVSAMRLTEKGYSVLVLERGKRYRDQDFATTNWKAWKYLWIPQLRCFGILQISPFKDVIALHGSGVGGGSLGYANILMKPSDKLFENPAWRHLADWKTVLEPHYHTARRMLGVAQNPRMLESDDLLYHIATERGCETTFQPTDAGVFFGEPGVEVADPYFGGEGPARTGCTYCGGCMVGCRKNAKNTLEKNYLYFAEKWGARVLAESEVSDIRPLPAEEAGGARYEVVYQSTTHWLPAKNKIVRAHNIIFSAGALGTLRLLFRCRDHTGSLPNLSNRLGDMVRTNSEALLGVSARSSQTDYSKGLAITSIFSPDEVTAIEPVRYPAGSSLMRFLSAPLITLKGSFFTQLLRIIGSIFLHPIDFLRIYGLPGWARNTTIMLVMQTEDNRLRIRPGRSIFSLFRKALVSQPDSAQSIPRHIDIGHQVVKNFAQKMNGIPAGTLNEVLLNIPMTAHILGGCPFGETARDGVIDINCQVHGYPGLFVVDGSIMPANPGINPSLTITALAEYAMSRIPVKPGASTRQPLGLWRS